MPLAVVTGASRGIGRAIASALADQRYDLLLVSRNREALERVKADVSQTVRVEVLPIDLAREDGPDRVLATCNERFGRADVLVNNAGVAPNGSFGSYTRTDWQQAFSINAEAPFFLTQRLLPLLRSAAPGYVINVGSVVSKRAYPNQAVYSASKHALLGWTKSLAQEIPTEELRVHAILPGGVDTEMIREVRPDIDGAKLIAPEEVADVVLTLLSMHGNAMIDEVSIRRQSKPGF